MTIVLLETGSKLDLPLNLKLNIEMTSPIFSKAGSMSLPISLPLTDKNRKLLQFPDRLDIYDSEEAVIRAIPDISVIVMQGSWQQVATMCISEYSNDAVEATLYFNESNIWSKLDAVTVPQAMADRHFGTIPEYYNQLEYYRAQVLAQFYDYMIPPGLFGTDLNTWLLAHDFIVAAMKTKDGWLNEPACVKRYVTGSLNNWTLHEELMTKQHTYDGNTYKTPCLKSEYDWYTTTECYGKTAPRYYNEDHTYIVGYENKNKHLYCTGFLRLDVVIKQIFSYLGYTLSYDFTTYWPYASDGLEVIWNQIVVLNNTMDAIYPGYMPYSALVPEVSAKEFIAAVQAQFGVVFTLQPDNKTVRMQFTEKILKLFSKTRDITAMRNKQVAFNSSPDYMPMDEMDNIKAPEYQLDAWSESLRDAICITDGIDPATIDYNYGQCYSFELDGVCQRTSSTRVGDSDETKTSECPLAFGVCTEMFDTQILTSPDEIYQSCLIEYIQVWSRLSPEIEESDQLYVNTTNHGICNEFNTEYNTIAENCDKITITTVLPTLEANQFDFTTPSIIQGRLCWPAKLQYELENSDKQHVTIEFIAGRKL